MISFGVLGTFEGVLNPQIAPQNHRVVTVRYLTEKTCVLEVSRGDFSFTAGQCVSLGVPKTAVNREYSIYSSEKDENLKFLIRVVEGGTVSTSLAALRPGDCVELNGPFGCFTLKPDQLKLPHCFIASGTGIAPFHSMIHSHDIDYTIFHGVRLNDETYEASEYKKGRYLACVSGEKSPYFNGRVTALLREQNFPKDAVFYLCGNRAMINDAYDILRDKGFSSDVIHTEVFF